MTMRQIKFRAKTLANGHWVYGNLVIRDKECVSIRNSKSEPWVDPETVGQFTGLTDCNGKEIYEGDIVKISIRATAETAETNERNAELMGIQMPSWIDGGDIIARVSYFDCAFHFIHLRSYLPSCGENVQEPMYKYLFHERHPDALQMFQQTIEVIGNIHDNPELIPNQPTEV